MKTVEDLLKELYPDSGFTKAEISIDGLKLKKGVKVVLKEPLIILLNVLKAWAKSKGYYLFSGPYSGTNICIILIASDVSNKTMENLVQGHSEVEAVLTACVDILNT